MNDLAHVGTFFLIFAAMLALYGALLMATGNKNLLPYRAIHSVHGPSDVRHVGRITVIVATVVGIASLIMKLVVR